MNKIDSRIYIIYTLFIGYLIAINTIISENFLMYFNKYINPVVWIILFLISLWISIKDKQRIKAKISKLQTVFIVVLVYLMIYFALGLFIGYTRTPYSRTFIGILMNIWIYISVIVFQEYVRNTLIRNTGKSKLLISLSIILFILFDISIYNIIDIGLNYTELFKYSAKIILPAIASNLLFTYLSKTSGFEINLIYRIPIQLAYLLLPIVPDLDWYGIAILGVVLPFTIYIFIKTIHDKKTVRESRGKMKKNSLLKALPLIFIIAIIVTFVSGIYKYKPLAIMSNSMYPLIKRGDAVIMEKIDDKLLNNLEIHDIIVYRLENTIVVHRLIYIEEKNNGKRIFIAQGDNNNMPDEKIIEENQILGIIRYKVPKVGYPSVLLSELFNKQQAKVETGK